MSKDTDEPNPEAVGYGKPPKAHQFKPGQSGNPKGRPKGPGSLMKCIMKHAGKKVTVIEGGVEKRMPKMDVVIAAMFGKASKGDVSAARLLATLILAARELQEESAQPGYTDEDLKAILAEADWQAQLAQIGQEQGTHDP
ncbi:DUF5681 domain-containing protein [Albidovulum sediminicola]|uniref:DUF5681 domain-containing protein n=1 Tax=Albidovulum sediminicola TaxID=2984331 RepID=A0ABT2Z6X5_9RHOB|nr:DUF5681 domain-containing protein [Defluviimonas sp. WL0075]MCV2866831.1 DUF5681 domain-containing protein [Defluviimonas sp. WL0075]